MSATKEQPHWGEQGEYKIVKNIPEVDPEILRKWCTGFYYWWHNQSGNNTQQGFQDYHKLVIDGEIKL